jgi:hypothetical protein
MKQNSSRRKYGQPAIAAMLALLVMIGFTSRGAGAALTPRQIEAFSSRIGRTFWTKPVDNRSPLFLSRPAPGAPSFPAPPNESFVIAELVGEKTSNPYYKVRFESDKEGYITPSAFHEELNLTILTTEPDVELKRKAAQAAELEQQRKDWIKAQAWSPSVKEAALNHRAVPGMTTLEVRKVLGEPIRMIKSRNARLNLAEERWVYANGSELLFQNTLLVRVAGGKESKEGQTAVKESK